MSVRNILTDATVAKHAPNGNATLPPFTIFLLISALFLAVWGENLPSPFWKNVSLVAASVYFLGGSARLYAHSQGSGSVSELLRKIRRGGTE